MLASYWEDFQLRSAQDGEDQDLAALGESARHVKTEADEATRDTHDRHPNMSESTMLEPSGRGLLTPLHPARSTTDLLDTFGPLVFPLYRALLMRKRVLLICRPPLRQSCHFGKEWFGCQI